MTAAIENGDYVLQNHSLAGVAYTDALLQSVLMLLRLPRKQYYPDKNLGSYLYQLQDFSFEDQVLALARQAVADVSGVFIKSVNTKGRTATFSVLLNGEERQVSLSF